MSTPREVLELLREMTGQSVVMSAAIAKSVGCGDFVGSVKFVESLVGPAEEMGHHPDLEISWDTVTVTISTHSEGGLTAADFELAGKIDALA